MWQPFNGLEVFPDGTNPGPVDENAFKDIPPTLCKKKGGALIRIKCDDDGYPKEEKKQLASTTQSKTTSKDHARARQIVPRESFRGESFGHMSSVLNKWLERDTRVGTLPCEEWNAREIQQLQGLLYLLRDDNLDEIYQNANDNRRMRATLDDLQHSWDELNKIVDANAHLDLHSVQRDGTCVVILYATDTTASTMNMQYDTRVLSLSLARSSLTPRQLHQYDPIQGTVTKRLCGT